MNLVRARKFDYGDSLISVFLTLGGGGASRFSRTICSRKLLDLFPCHKRNCARGDAGRFLGWHTALDRRDRPRHHAGQRSGCRGWAAKGSAAENSAAGAQARKYSGSLCRKSRPTIHRSE